MIGAGWGMKCGARDLLEHCVKRLQVVGGDAGRVGSPVLARQLLPLPGRAHDLPLLEAAGGGGCEHEGNVYVHVYVHVCMCVCVCVYVYVCMCMCMCVCVRHSTFGLR